jgi:hypothetical protein
MSSGSTERVPTRGAPTVKAKEAGRARGAPTQWRADRQDVGATLCLPLVREARLGWGTHKGCPYGMTDQKIIFKANWSCLGKQPTVDCHVAQSFDL